ncbi:Hypothetical_protein [Hexamita inflata]|uniref:Hypothetical_protein n=1 Tax=Hexamita inflata TaxID=28002 RepID=A0AA86UQL6_9EUKA|nr:Hypothetical protein HINF_LOCUS51794 [Hexamita inflata]
MTIQNFVVKKSDNLMYCQFKNSETEFLLHECDPQSIKKFIGTSQRKFFKIAENCKMPMQMQYLEKHQVIAFRMGKNNSPLVFNLTDSIGRKKLHDFEAASKNQSSSENMSSIQANKSNSNIIDTQLQNNIVISKQKLTDKKDSIKQEVDRIRITCLGKLNSIDLVNTRDSKTILSEAQVLLDQIDILEQILRLTE